MPQGSRVPNVHVSDSTTSSLVATCRTHRALELGAPCGDLGNATFSFRSTLGPCEPEATAPRESDVIAIATIRTNRKPPRGGRGRALTCRPVGACPPERLTRGWMANRGARTTRVSEMRLSANGAAAQPGTIPATVAATPTITRMRRAGTRVLRRSG